MTGMEAEREARGPPVMEITMTRSQAAAGRFAAHDRTSLYEDITVKIIAELEAGHVPWVQPWSAAAARAPLGLPKNAATGRTYSGSNILILWEAVIERGFLSQSWLTFRQALALGGAVKKGERGTTVVYTNRFVPEKERARARRNSEDARSIAFLKRFTVFNIEQCEGLPEAVSILVPPIETHRILPQAEVLIQATGADIRIGGDRAFYDVADDFIHVSPIAAYFKPINWHQTALHELAHWSGAADRMARYLSGAFASKAYIQEELVAEMAAAFSCAALGIVPTVRHADYIGSWPACALGHKACRDNRSVLYRRVPKLFGELALARGDGRYARLMKTPTRVEILILDDWGLQPLDAAARHDLLEIVEERHGGRSTIITSQPPVEQWHALIGDPTYADAILDRLVHNAHRIDLAGESIRKTRSRAAKKD